MYKYSKKSLAQRETIHPDLRRVFDYVLKFYDHVLIQGRRSKDEQTEYFIRGRSKVEWPNSRHNVLDPNDLAEAVDVSPYPIPDDWGNLNTKERAKFYHFAGFVKAAATMLGVGLRWGGDWDGDDDFDDQTFDDLVHFELIERETTDV